MQSKESNFNLTNSRLRLVSGTTNPKLANLGFVVPLTNLNLLLVRLKLDSLLCIAVIKLVTKFAP